MSLQNDIFESWRNGIYETYGIQRFLSKNRKECLEDLVTQLVSKNVPYDDAKLLTKKLSAGLVTKKGATGIGNYKGWKERVEADFVALLFDLYNEKGLIPTQGSDQSSTTLNSPQIKSLVTYEKHPLIESWGKSKYGELWTEDLSQMANNPENSLHDLFLDEYFN